MAGRKQNWDGWRGFEDDYIGPGIRRRHLNEMDDDEPEEYEPVFTHCNVCGRPLRERYEDECGMCEKCMNE